MLAAIDLGTNSARLLIGDIQNHRVNPVLHSRIVTRMGAGVGEQGKIEREAMERTAAALKKFRQIVDSEGVDDVDIFATSAARRASNREELAGLVKSLFHKELRIISGEEEARLSYEGAVGELVGLPAEAVPVVVDIGGGSTEICIKVEENFHGFSLAMGAVRFTENPVNQDTMVRLLSPVKETVKQYSPLALVGVGGTAATLAAINQKLLTYDPKRIHGYKLRQEQVRATLKLLESLSLEQRKKLPGLEPARADIIVSGTGILLTIMEQMETELLTVSEADLLHGAIMELNKSRLQT